MAKAKGPAAGPAGGDSGDSGSGSVNKNPFKSGYYEVGALRDKNGDKIPNSGKIDIAINKVKNDGTIVIWAKSSAGVEETHSFRMKGSDGLFQSAPLVCSAEDVAEVNIEKGPCNRIGETDQMVFPVGYSTAMSQASWHFFVLLKTQVKECFGIDIMEDHCEDKDIRTCSSDDNAWGAVARSSNAYWRSGRDSRVRHSWQTWGDFEVEAMTLYCNFFGYQTYVTSDSVDHHDRLDGRVNWTSGGDNRNVKVKSGMSIADFQAATKFSDVFTHKNRNTNAFNAYYETWITKLVCKDPYGKPIPQLIEAEQD